MIAGLDLARLFPYTRRLSRTSVPVAELQRVREVIPAAASGSIVGEDLPGPLAPTSYKGDYRMALYEHTVMSRQDISAQQAEALNDTIKGLIEQGGGSVAKIEYWGLRNLTYRVKKNRKAHYSLLAVDCPPAAMAEVERQLSINEDVLRWLTVRVEELDLELSPLLARRERERERERERTPRDDAPAAEAAA